MQSDLALRTGDRRQTLRMKISFNLPYPPTINIYWRHAGGRMMLSKRRRQYRNLAMEELLDQGVAGIRISDHVAVRIEVYVSDWRRRDLDNLPKGVLDALTHARVWGDDHQVDELRLIRMPRTVKGGCWPSRSLRCRRSEGRASNRENLSEIRVRRAGKPALSWG